MSNYVLVFRSLPRTAGHPRGGRGLGGCLRSTQAAWLVSTALKRGAGLRGAGARGFQRRATATGTWLRELDTSTPQGARPGNRGFPAAQSIELM